MNMKMTYKLLKTSIALFAVMAISISGCSKEDATQAVQQAEESAENAAESIGESVDSAVEGGKEMASELGEKAQAFMTPLKEKFGDLESLKDKPEELKTAVSDLIQSIEEKAEGIELPEAMTSALATVKEKLVELKDYLEGEADPAKIEEHLKDIGESVKSGLGMSSN